MSRIILLMHLSSFLVAHLFISGVVSTTFTITNSCAYTVWPGVSSSGASASALSTTGFSLEKNESKIIEAPASWSGRFWGRTYCTEDSSGNFSCITGDCGSGKLECSGRGGAPPATLAEFALDGFNGLDYYDVSVVDGFNLPLLVVPSGQNCSSTGCIGDVIESCPPELAVTTGTERKKVGCKSTWSFCPQSYRYSSQDDTNATYTCPSTDYQITFCPGKSINTTYIQQVPGRKWGPIIAGVVGGVLAIISFVVIFVLRVRWSKSEDTEEDEEDDHIQLVPGMPVRMLQEKAGQDRLIDIVDNLDDQYMPSDREEIIRMIKIAVWCLQDDPERRPLMSTVVKVVEGVMEVDSNLVYKFSRALTPPPAVDAHISSAPPPASVLSNPR
ncbi:hypothetical protein OIU74_006869 [Salix koriyanagi]|uniref:Uncharacterized protein n=1 Tax=Salix koriyanagi TaxID=2511006 RepID=A0A9Q0UEY7_9ROSI|nr:hypothetical protein OIU74_006869 [Salix koriyanagi]